MSGRQVYLTWDGGEVYLRGDHPEQRGLFVTGDGIEGWDSAPTPKVSMTEKQTGDGAHDISANNILYSARTVIINFRAHGNNRNDVLGLIEQVAKACGNLVKLRIVDASRDLYCVGYIEHSMEAEWSERWGVGSITVVCPDPIKKSTRVNKIQLSPVSSGFGGLYYGEDGVGLSYPLSYGTVPEGVNNLGTILNSGNHKSYPLITVNGRMNGGFILDFGEYSLSYSQPVDVIPLVLNSKNRIASIGGLDVSRNLVSRGFPEMEPGESLSVAFLGYGDGWVDIEWNDSFI